MRAALAGHIHVRALVDASGTSIHAPPFRLRADLIRPACWGRGVVPNRASAQVSR